MADTITFALDVFSVFNGRLSFSGWLFGASPIASIAFRSSGVAGGSFPLASYGTVPSPDVAQHYGPAGARARFSETCDFVATTETLADAHFLITYTNGRTEGLGDLVGQQPNPANLMAPRFAKLLREWPKGHLLEVGSRARSGVVRRDLVPEGWDYTGFDVMEGPNVDVVGDVHEITTQFGPDTFHAVMAFSVLEHLLMPWKAIIELNRVMVTGGVGLFTTHQCWPLHDQPWDFWRFSDRAWDGLLNKVTGFEVIEASMGEPAFVVAQRCHGVTNFGLSQNGFLASNVLFRKIGPTELQWPVRIEDAISTRYPEGNIV